MSGKEKIEKDYKEFEAAIEKIAQEELSLIRKKIEAAKSEAELVGEAVEKNLNREKTASKKS